MTIRMRLICIRGFSILLSAYIFFNISSCRTAGRAAYFQDVPDSLSGMYVNLNLASYAEPEIQPGDVLNINIQTLVQDLSGGAANSSPAQNYTANSGTSFSSQTPSDFPVSKTGIIKIPILGKFNAGGLTTSMLQDSLYLLASRYFKDPVINVRFANFTITVLGEVGRPGHYVVPNEKISVLEAFGIAGDLTIYAKRDNILLLRNTTDKKQAVRLDLTSSASLRSPYFYLKQGDVIFVEPNKSKITASTDGNRTRNYALIASGLSVLIILISRLTF